MQFMPRCYEQDQLAVADRPRVETVFSMQFMPRCYEQDQLAVADRHRVETDSNTCTVALQVIGGDEKRTQCLEV
jgi:hypothetical protein